MINLDSRNASQAIDFSVISTAKIDSENFIELTRGENISDLSEIKEHHKVVKFLSGWSFDEILNVISGLEAANYKSLFIFILNVGKCKGGNDPKNKLQTHFESFLKSRQIIIQMTSKDEMKIFYNPQTNGLLHEILRMPSNAAKQNEIFPSFLNRFLDLTSKNHGDCEQAILKLLHRPDPLTLRFLTIFEFSSEFPLRLIPYCDTVKHFYAAIGIPFGEENHKKFLIKALRIYPRIVIAAFDSKKTPILDLFIDSFLKYINLNIQIELSNKLMDSGNIDKLCDLLESRDFPFPTIDMDLSNIRLNQIVNERNNFHAAIENKMYEEINAFIATNKGNLDIVYSTNNKSALHTALHAKRAKVFRHLKSNGFQGHDYEHLREGLMMENIQILPVDPSKAVYLLVLRSKIFGKFNDQEHREKIKSWFEAIEKTEFGGALISAASQCANLQIVFDFESDDVERVDLDSKDADGIMYPAHKVVIIAAKYSKQEDEQRIKGTLAHELAHYVMRMLFQNRDQPYLHELDPRYEKYKQVVENYRYLEDGEIYDGCEDIISLVYTGYDETDYDAELIVRFFQILVHFDNNESVVNECKANFKDLYEFTKLETISLMENLKLNEMEYVRNYNENSKLLSNIRDFRLQLKVSENVKNLLSRKFVVVTANIPKLFFIEMCNYLYQIHGNLIDTKNVFLAQENLTSREFLKGIRTILREMKDVNVFIDFTSGNFQALQSSYFDIPSDQNFVIVVKDDIQLRELLRIVDDEELSPVNVSFTYEWKHLEENVRERLLQHKVNFQNNLKLHLSEMIGSLPDLSNVIDSKILNMIFDNVEISINSDLGIFKKGSDMYQQLFLERSFIGDIKKGKISQKKLFKQTKNHKFVLISDVAGSGKSWAMRNFALDSARSKPSHWVTFVDLKRFIPYFNKCVSKHEEKSASKIYDFLIDETLKDKSTLEIEIFKQKYKAGEFSIFLDGFDEIAPDCAEYVKEMIKSFPHIKKSQLFVSTRDHFKVELQVELRVDVAYKLVSFESKEGVELIARIWRFNDFNDSESEIAEERKFEEYKELAEELAKKLPGTWNGIGLPQIFTMIAKITKEHKRFDERLSTYELYMRMWEDSCKEWETEKGKLREKLGAKGKSSKLNFLTLHELKAMQTFAPGKSLYCDIDPRDEWKGVYIDGCGLMTQKFEKFVFNHETFYEFFVAEFIVRNLRDLKRANEAFGFFLEVMHNDKYSVIQKFLDEALVIEKSEMWSKFDRNIFDKDKAERFRGLAREMSNNSKFNLYKIFIRDLEKFEYLGIFLNKILSMCDKKAYGTFTEAITKATKFDDKSNIGSWTISKGSYRALIDLVISSVQLPILYKIINTMGTSLIKNILNSSDEDGENIFWGLAGSAISTTEQFKKFMKFLHKYMTVDEIAVAMMKVNNDGESIFNFYNHFKDRNVELNISILEIFWSGFEEFFRASNAIKAFKYILLQKDKDNRRTFLHSYLTHMDSVDVHERIWNLLAMTFENDKSFLRNLILEPNCYQMNFIQQLIRGDDRRQMLEFTMTTLKRILGKDEFLKVFQSKSIEGENLLCYAITYSNNIKVHEIFWQFFKDSLASTVNMSDFYGNNFLHYAARYSKEEILWRVLSSKEMRILSHSLNSFDQNFLQYSILFNRSYEFHENLWQRLKIYLATTEIISLVKNCDVFGINYLNVCLMSKNKDLAKFTAKKVLDNLRELDGYGKLSRAVRNTLAGAPQQGDTAILSLNWIDNENSDTQPPLIDPYTIHKLLIHETNIDSDNFMHRVLRDGTADYIKPVLEVVRTKLSKEVLQKILISFNKSSRENFLQVAIREGVSREVNKYLWTLIHEKLDSERLLDILKHKDAEGNNLFLTIATHATKDIIEVTWDEINELNKNLKRKIFQLIQESNASNENIFQLIMRPRNCVLGLHLKSINDCFKSSKILKKSIMELTNDQTIFLILQKHAECVDRKCQAALWEVLFQEIKNQNRLKNLLVNCQHEIKRNLVQQLVKINRSSEIVLFTLDMLKSQLGKDRFRKILISTDIDEHNLLYYVLTYSKDVEILDFLLKQFDRSDDVLNFILKADKSGQRVFHFASKAEFLNSIYKELSGMKNDRLKKAIMSPDKRGRNCINWAAMHNKSKEFHESLWRIIHAFLNKNEILELVNHSDNEQDNVMQKAVKYNTTEIISFISNQLKTILEEKSPEA